jgi:hydrophobic/amphiphilic exporter-1 (mainly G- bacteria), HAE1 family
MGLARLAVNRPVTTAMILVSIVVLGGIAAFRLPLAYLPEIDVPFIGVQIPYPNSNPQQVEKEIVRPVEEMLATIPGVKTLNARATADQAEFFLEFDWGNSLDIVRMQVGEKMDLIKPELPTNIGEVLIFSFNTSDIPVVQGRISAQGVDLAASYELLEARVVNRLRRIPGVARVDLGGVLPKEIYIDLILDRVAAHRVDVGALIRKLQGSTSNLVLGQVADDNMSFTARAVGSFSSIEEIANLPIDEHGLRLSDIAEINYEMPPIDHGRHLDGHYAVALEVYKESTANTVEVAHQVYDVLENDIGADPLLQGINVFVWEDQAAAITNGVQGLLTAGIIGGLLAVLCLYFFLRRLDSTLIVSLSIPFSVIAACGLLYFMGSSLNILSMMGLMLAVGMLVDNGIVVLESIDRHHRTEPNRKKSALFGSHHVAVAVTSSTLTTVIVFLPLILGGKTDMAVWLKEIGVSITIALGCSLFTAMTLIPLMSAHFLGRRRSKPIPSIARLEERYARVLGWTLGHPWKTVLGMVLVLVIGILPFVTGMVDAAMFSGTVNERVYLEYDFADFTYKSEAERKVNAVEAAIAPHKEELGIDSIYSYYSEGEAGTTFVLNAKNLSDDEVKELRKKIRELLPDLAGVTLRFDEEADSGGNSTFFAVKFFGQDTRVLEDLATEASRRLETVAGVQDVRTPFKEAQREIQVSIDREKGERLGLTAQDMADIFSFTLGSMRLPRFDAGSREVDTWLALRLEDRENLDDLRRIQFGGTQSHPLRLGDVADFQIVTRPREIERENRKVRMAVRATYEGEDWPKTKEEIEGLMNAFDLPAGYSWSWNDRIIEQADQSSQMAVNMMLALLLVYIVMASLFESLSQPFAILASIPFALPGVAWALALTHTSFNLMAQIGILILMGIVVNNGIVLLDHVKQLRDAGAGQHDAILQAGRERLRPILMTASTTVIGLLPLAVRGPNAGGVFYYPLARTVMGGLISSVVLTLLILPFWSVLIERFAGWARGIWLRSSVQRGTGDAAPAAPVLTAPRA